MKTCIKILIFIYIYTSQDGANFAQASQVPSDLTKWKQLLHYEDGTSEVISPEFFLSSKGRTNPKDELEKTLETLKSDHGFATACNFPARYTYLLGKYDDLPKYDLLLCKKLSEFVNSFQSNHLSLVLASPFYSDLSSTFGHILIALHKDPVLDLNSDIIQFAALTNNESILKYAYKGIFGGFKAHFMREPFFRKYHEYAIKEQRYLHIYTLDIKKDQITFLLYHLFELRKATFNYYFIKNNCAYKINNILSLLDNKNEFIDDRFVLPIEVIRSRKGLIGNQHIFPPPISKERVLYKKLDTSEKKALPSYLTGNLNPDENTSEALKELSYINYLYNFKKRKNRFANVSGIKDLSFNEESDQEELSEPIDRNLTSKISLSATTGGSNGYQIQYRPLSTDIYDITAGNMHESNVNLLDFSLSVFDHNVRLEALALLDIRSLSSMTHIQKPISYSTQFGLNRNNEKRNLELEFDTGVGVAINIAEFLASVTISPGLNITNLDVYIKPEIYIGKRINEVTKIGLLSSEKISRQSYYQHQIFLSHEINNKLISIKIENNEAYENHLYSATLGYYF